MVVVFTIREVNHLLHIHGIKFLDCSICFVSGRAKKADLLSSNVIYHVQVGAHPAKIFSNKNYSH